MIAALTVTVQLLSMQLLTDLTLITRIYCKQLSPAGAAAGPPPQSSEPDSIRSLSSTGTIMIVDSQLSLHLRLVMTLCCPLRTLEVPCLQLLQQQLVVGSRVLIQLRAHLPMCHSTSCVHLRALLGPVTCTEHCRSTTGGMQ